MKRALALIALGLAGCSGPAPDVALLASDAHFVVADQRVVLPVVALRSVSPLSQDGAAPAPDVAGGDARIKELAGSAAAPARTAAVTVHIRAYKYHGEHTASIGICPRLTRKWAQYLCRGERIGILRDLPETFELVDRRHLVRFEGQAFAGGGRRSDHIARMELAVGQPDVACTPDVTVCTAAVAPSDAVVAVWTVSAASQEEAEAAGRRQGAAILSFVRNAIGEREAFERLGLPMAAPRA